MARKKVSESRKKSAEAPGGFEKLALGSILAIALALRIWGIWFGLPDLYHADEPMVVNHAMAYGAGDLNPHFFKLPPLVSYLLFAVYGFFYLGLRLLGQIPDAEALAAMFLADPSIFYLIARILFGAILGTATVYLLYRLVRSFFSKEHALLTAWFLATAFLHVRDSHYIYVDIPLLTVLTAAFFPILKILLRGKMRQYLLFGALLGTAVAVKYNGVFLMIPFALAHAARNNWKADQFVNVKFASACALSLAVFALWNPFSWLDWRSFLAELFQQSHAEGFTGIAHHLTYSLNGALGFPVLALGVAGFLRSLVGENRPAWIVGSFVGVYYLVLCFFGQHYDRYVLPLLPFLVFFSANTLVEMQKRWRFRNFFLGLLAVALALPSLAKICLSNQIFTREDIRTRARKRIEASIPSEIKIALDVSFFSPHLRPTSRQLEAKRREVLSRPDSSPGELKRMELMIREARKDIHPRYELYFLTSETSAHHFLFARPVVPYDVNRLRALGIAYVVVAKVNPDFQPSFYRDLAERATLLARFNPYKDASRKWPIDRQPLTGGPFLWTELVDRERNGHILEVYRL